MDVALLLGLVVATDAERPRAFRLGLFRLGRGIAECGQSEAVLPALRRIATDPGVDALNRVRALQVLAIAMAHDQAETPLHRDTSMSRTLESVAEDLKDLEVPAAARAWLLQH